MEMLWYLLLLAAPAIARDVTDEEYAKFPRLYHLDDYDACLSKVDGLYCLGSFHITPLSLREPHHVYNMLKDYSQDLYHFNRTQLHRGYCVSSRCPSLVSEKNTTLRFERCASQWARRLALRTTLASLRYCRSHAQEVAGRNPEPMDTPQKVFLYVVAAILLCNVAGTVYDVVTGENVKKNALLSSWSVRGNWRRLTASYEDGDPRLAALTPVQGIRVLLMVLIMATHSGCIHVMLYLYNPRWIEQVFRHPALMIFLNGTSVVQIFVMLSNFLLGYNLLLYTKNNSISYKLLPYITIKRISRISPLHMLVVGFAATWWSRGGGGAQWAAVRAEHAACRQHFWPHVFYVHNLVQTDGIFCLVPTWFLAVDMQLYMLASVLTVYLARRRARALPALAALVLLSCALNGLLAYTFDWKSIVYYAYPSNLSTMYKGIPSFTHLYQAPWGSLPACLIGLFLAFLHFDLQEQGVKASTFERFRFAYNMSPVLMIVWILAGWWVRARGAAWFGAAYVALERPVISLLAAGIMLGMVNGLEGWLKHLMAWRGWHAMGRMSLAVLMVHWCINLYLAASRPQPIATSVLSVVVDTAATGILSYLVAIPLTIMVEMPVQRFVTSLVVTSKDTKQS